MKRGIFFTAVIAAAALCGCVRNESNERFEPTKPGYYLFWQANTALQYEMEELWPVFAFAGYYGADTEEMRERIHDAFFYTSRIARNGDQWRIISEDTELVIDTGGKSLYDQGARWTYFYAGRDYYTSELPAITRTGTESAPYTLNMPAMPERPCGISGELTLSQSFIHRPAEEKYSVKINISGGGQVRSGNRQVGFGITEPLEYDSALPAFDKGGMTLTTTKDGVTDTAKAQILSINNLVGIEYNGYYNEWDIIYGYSFRYE